MISRRVLVPLIATCVAAVLIAGLDGCTTAEVACDIRADYRQEIPPWTQGTVTVRWQYNAELPPNVHGTTECFGEPRFCLIKIKGPPASFRDVCGMATEIHELHHAEGARHEH